MSYTIHCTKKLLDRVKPPARSTPTKPTTYLGNWYATALFWRPQVALLVNERTLLPVLMPLAPATELAKRFPEHLSSVLLAHGAPHGLIEHELAAMHNFQYDKTANRSLVGSWSAADFWRALHHGQAPDGRWLNPAFPYTHTTRVSREDSNALFAYLQHLPADETPNRPHALRWPYGTQAALKVWRALYFTPGPSTQSPTPPRDEIERGRQLVDGLAHCSACHTPRDRLGGLITAKALSGANLPNGWYAPSLLDPKEAGVQGWALDDVVRLLRDGQSGHHAAIGPMAEVVAQSLRHWNDADLRAVAYYLVTLPQRRSTLPKPADRAATHLALGQRVYEQHCAACHGEQGQGFQLRDGRVAYPPLAGNRAVTISSPANLLRIVQEGGFGLPTAQHPQPFGMPPFQMVLDDNALAALLTYIRQSWGNSGTVVQPLDVLQLNHRRGR